jgi:hypothetical protein
MNHKGVMLMDGFMSIAIAWPAIKAKFRTWLQKFTNARADKMSDVANSDTVFAGAAQAADVVVQPVPVQVEAAPMVTGDAAPIAVNLIQPSVADPAPVYTQQAVAAIDTAAASVVADPSPALDPAVASVVVAQAAATDEPKESAMLQSVLSTQIAAEPAAPVAAVAQAAPSATKSIPAQLAALESYANGIKEKLGTLIGVLAPVMGSAPVLAEDGKVDSTLPPLAQQISSTNVTLAAISDVLDVIMLAVEL